VPVLFWEDPDGLYVMPSASGTRWLSDSLRHGGCELIRADGRSSRCSAELVADSNLAERVRAEFRAKYGAEVYARYFGPRSKVVRLVAGVAAVRRTPTELLVQEFNAVAPGYTDGVEGNPIELYLKQTTRDRLLAAFAGRDRLLEIGAGTGLETLPLLSAGHPIVVVDLSPRMMETLTERARRLQVEPRLECREGSLGRLADALRSIEDGGFDGAYSTFGAFNLEGDLGSAPSELARVLKPHSKLAFTSLNRPGLFPVVWELPLGNLRGVTRRAQTELPSGSIRYPLTVYPRNPSYWDRALGGGFRRVETLPVSVTAPPFASPRILRLLGARGSARVRRWDEWLSRRSMLAALGEWTYLTYERLA
jgi:SAM-dependent methyltransferase